MSICQFITIIRESKVYRRALIVRAIEDAIVILCMVIAIWLVCVGFTGLFRLLGVM